MSNVAAETFIKQTLIGPYAVGEIPPPLQITFTDCAGSIIDLSGYSVSFSIVSIDGNATPSGVAAGISSVVGDAVNGITQYVWEEADFQTEGMFRGVMWAANGTLRYSSEFFEWFVRDSLTTPGV